MDAKFVINVQGDEPLINPADIQRVIEAITKNENDLDVIAGYCTIKSKEELENRNIPKVVMDTNHNLLYTSRSPIPGNKKNDSAFGWRQVCVYAFSQKAMALIRRNPEKQLLEEIEDLELLRFLELGVNVKMIELTDTSVAVDVPSDIEEVIKKLNGI